MPAAKKAELRQSLIDVGQLHPILITDDNYIIEGTVRWELLLEIHGPDCPVDSINLTCHSGIGGKLPKTVAYRHCNINDEREATEDRIRALRPWSWSRPAKSRPAKSRPYGLGLGPWPKNRNQKNRSQKSKQESKQSRSKQSKSLNWCTQHPFCCKPSEQFWLQNGAVWIHPQTTSTL